MVHSDVSRSSRSGLGVDILAGRVRAITDTESLNILAGVRIFDHERSQKLKLMISKWASMRA